MAEDAIKNYTEINNFIVDDELNKIVDWIFTD
jgi:hypothetical protein